MSSITEQIMGAWDEDEAPTQESTETSEPVVTSDAEDETVDEDVFVDEVEEAEEEEEVSDEEPIEEDEEEEEEPSEEEQAEEPAGDKSGEPVTFSSEDPAVLAFLERHSGDVEIALREALRFESALGRQGRELGQYRQRVQQLEAELEQATLFRGGSSLSPEQVEWVEEAATSENVLGYVQAAVEQGEFDLARAVLENADVPAGQVLRVAQAIDRAEQLAQPVEEAQPLHHNVLLELLVENFPEMPKFEAEMVSTMQTLGQSHPLVALAQSQDPAEAAQGIIGIYEIARAKTATVTSTREQVTRSRRASADAVRSKAQVSSSAASPQRASTPRNNQLMPGLTLEALEAEFDAE